MSSSELCRVLQVLEADAELAQAPQQRRDAGALVVRVEGVLELAAAVA